MVIYKTTFPNGKIYIGQQRVEDRNYFGSGVECTRAIKKYGKENLTKEILRTGIDNQETLDIWEKVFILKFKSYDKNIGYNIIIGTSNKFGAGSPMLIKEVRDKCSASNKRRHEENPELRKEASEYFKDFWSKNPRLKKQISNTLKGRYIGEKNPNFGNNWTEEQKEEQRKRFEDREYSGSQNPNFGKRWSEEKKEAHRFKVIERFAGNPENNPMFGKKRITNGIENTIISVGDEMPEGWRFGMTMKPRK